MHTIHNIVFEVDVNHGEQQISWEQYYVEFFQDRLLAKVEKLCNNWDAKYPNTKCSIDEIDINVEVDSTNLEELQEKIITQISDQLHNINNNNTTTSGSVRATITSLASPFDALVLYLKNGILPAYISVKIFKEWLANIQQFTVSEKETLTVLFSSNIITIERMLSLVRNDYEKFAAILETRQKITKQFIKLEETFFKKFVKAICEKLHIPFTEAQTTIWFKTLGISSSLEQFSKTFLQLLIPKAAAAQKRLVNVNEQQLSVTMLQAIVQNYLQKPIDISIEKIFDVISIAKAESITYEVTKKTVDKKVDDITDSTTKEAIKQTESDIKSNTKLSQKSETTKNDHANQKDVSSTQKREESISKDHQKNNSIEESSNQNDLTSENSSEIDLNEKSTDTTIASESSSIDKVTQNELDRKKFENQENNTVESSKILANKNNAENDSNEKSNSMSKTDNSEGNMKANDQEKNKKASDKEIDRTIFEKLAKNNIPVREIPLSTEKAGLILLHPFLGRFFDGAKLVDADNKISDIGKACMLLHFLATGTEEVTDVELTLEKILLGIPLDAIINYQTPLTAEDKELCEELLKAVIKHWSILKNSSVNTLRDMFLKREGQITLKEDSVKLVIERYAQDILLDKVPWSIGIFQLKWMDKMMHIEW